MLDTAEATSTLLRLFLLVFFAGETGVLFLHLLRGVVDTFAFIIGALQLLLAPPLGLLVRKQNVAASPRGHRKPHSCSGCAQR